MATERQIEANRANAQRSTGPVTADGKARVRQNATKHGLTAANVVIAGEDARDFGELLDALRDDLRPVGATEEMLVQLIAESTWRLRRATVIEAGVFDYRLDVVDSEVSQSRTPDPRLQLGRAYVDDAQKGDVLSKLNRYETTHYRRIDSALKRLEQLQEKRCDPDDSDTAL
jgi:hypothetical protein